MILFRPVGLKELELIAEADFAAFPPRLPEQPIFYPVLNVEYARAIARDWNTDDERSGFVGFVTVFEVEDGYVRQFPVQVVGGRDAQELWVPAEDLATFNTHIVGKIRVIESFVGPRFQGTIDSVTNLPVR
jgi:hypothetical protein